MKHFIIFLAFVTLLISSVSHASELKFIGTDDDGSKWAIDPSSIVQRGSIIKVLVQINYREGKKFLENGELIKQALYLKAVNCETQQVGTKSSQLLGADGHEIASEFYKDNIIKWEYVVPYSAMEKTLKYVCSHQSNT